MTITLTFTQAQISEHIARHSGAVVPMNTDADAWCEANCESGWTVERADDRKFNSAVEFTYGFTSTRDAALFKMFWS